jgi:hypothetical protein
MKTLPPLATLLICLEEAFDGAVIGLLNILGEKAAGELAFIPVIPNTLTALPPPVAGFIGACTGLFVFVYNAIHLYSNLSFNLIASITRNYTGARLIDQGNITF